MKVFVNVRGKVAAIVGQVVYELQTKQMDSFAIVETWLRGQWRETGPQTPMEYQVAAQAVEALILADNTRVGSLAELQHKNSDIIRLLNHNVNPSGRAGACWAMCR